MTENNLKMLIVLFKTQKNLNKHIKKSLVGSGLPVNEFAVLESLYNKGDMTVSELINYVLIPNSSMTYVVSRLVNKEYIKEVNNPKDQRVKILTLTDLGRAVFIKTYEKHYQHMRAQFDQLTKDEEATLVELLKKLGRSLEESL